MSTGLHARRATGLTGAEREENFTRTQSVARFSGEGGAAYKAEKSSAARFFCFDRRPAQEVPIRRKIIYQRERGFIILFKLLMICFYESQICRYQVFCTYSREEAYRSCVPKRYHRYLMVFRVYDVVTASIS